MKSVLSEAVRVVSEIAEIPAILAVVSKSTGMRFAAVAHVTDDRWVACQVRDELGFGLGPGGELDLNTTVCKHARAVLRSVKISDALAEDAVARHPIFTVHGLRSHITTPIVLSGGEVFGTLCAMDREPRDLSAPWFTEMFELFAELIAIQLNSQLKLAASEGSLADSRRDLAASQQELATSTRRLVSSRANLKESRADLAFSRAETATSAARLVDERAASELREQFIAVLGHDLRNPLASIDAGTKLLTRETLSERGRTILDLIGKSIGRMTTLIDDVLDFARGRLGGGISVDNADRVPLAPMLGQVINELRSSNPDRTIEVDLGGITEAHCDPARIGQLLSNLVANALTHGAVDQPIRIEGADQDGFVTLSVANGGKPIPDAAMNSLFQPFFRASARRSQQGLGLGLYIASEIAKAHGGTLTATSDENETRFTFRMPR